MQISTPQITVAISIGGGLSLALDKRNNLLLHDDTNRTSVNLGRLTHERADDLGEILKRLATHATG